MMLDTFIGLLQEVFFSKKAQELYFKDWKCSQANLTSAKTSVAVVMVTKLFNLFSFSRYQIMPPDLNVVIQLGFFLEWKF